MVPSGWLPGDDWGVHNSTRVDVPGKIDPHYSPYEMVQEDKTACATENASKSAEVIKPIRIMSREERRPWKEKHDKTVVRLPSYDVVKDDPVMYAHASRVFHLESNPAMRARWCRRTANATCGSTRRRCRWPWTRWMACTT
jgi:hypothetical protein